MICVVITEVANIYKKKKSQINGTILIKKISVGKTPKNMNKKKGRKKKTLYYVTRSRVKVHTIFFKIFLK